MSDEVWFERLAEATSGTTLERAPATLTSQVYSALLARLAETGSLLDLRELKTAGGRLCIFENAITVLPLVRELGGMNPCRICHARVLGERVEHAPIFWPGCPYSEFHNS